jgi:hypothetical protein
VIPFERAENRSTDRKAPAITAIGAQMKKRGASRSRKRRHAAVVESTGCTFRTTFTTVGLPRASARVKRIVPTAEPATPEKSRKPRLLGVAWRSSGRRAINTGRNMATRRTCS